GIDRHRGLLWSRGSLQRFSPQDRDAAPLRCPLVAMVPLPTPLPPHRSWHDSAYRPLLSASSCGAQSQGHSTVLPHGWDNTPQWYLLDAGDYVNGMILSRLFFIITDGSVSKVEMVTLWF